MPRHATASRPHLIDAAAAAVKRTVGSGLGVLFLPVRYAGRASEAIEAAAAVTQTIRSVGWTIDAVVASDKSHRFFVRVSAVAAATTYVTTAVVVVAGVGIVGWRRLRRSAPGRHLVVPLLMLAVIQVAGRRILVGVRNMTAPHLAAN
jgi:hypothetical protein